LSVTKKNTDYTNVTVLVFRVIGVIRV